MRFSFALPAAIAAALVSSSLAAAPPQSKPAKSKVAHADPLPTSKADPAVAGRALLVKELPKGSVLRIDARWTPSPPSSGPITSRRASRCSAHGRQAHRRRCSATMP